MTGYRDDREALAQENDSLKRELRELQSDNAMLRQGVLPPARAKRGPLVPVLVGIVASVVALTGTVVFLLAAPAPPPAPVAPIVRPAPPPLVTPPPSEAALLRVAIAPDGSLFVDGAPTTDEDLRERAQRWASASPVAGARIDADRSVPHERAVAVASLLRAAGVARVSFGVSSR